MTQEISPHVPITPEQIARQAWEAAAAGATIVHLHVCDPETAEGQHCECNAQLVTRAVRITRDLECELANPGDAREILDIAG